MLTPIDSKYIFWTKIRSNVACLSSSQASSDLQKELWFQTGKDIDNILKVRNTIYRNIKC